MDPGLVGVIGIVVLIILLLTRMPVAFVMLFVGFIGSAYMTGLKGALWSMAAIAFSTIMNYSYVVIPLFILMGHLASAAGLINKLFDTARRWVGHLPGGLAMATIAASAGFGAVCGSGSATTATMGVIAVPEMDRYGYDRRLSLGCVASSSGLAFLIPPSSYIVIIAILTDQSIGKLLIAGILPGIVLATILMLIVLVTAGRNPKLGPPVPCSSWKSRLVSLKSLWSVFIIMAIIIGGLYSGVFTPTESGAIAALVTFLIAVIMRQLTWANFKQGLLATGSTTAMIFIIMVGALTFTQFLALTELPFHLGEFIESLEVNRYITLTGIFLVYIMLGMFLEDLSMIVLTLPIFYPIILRLGFDPMWFGIILVILVQIAMLTPPVGLQAYIISMTVRDTPLDVVFRGIFPFFLGYVVVLVVLTVFPQIVTFLPSMMRR